MKKGQAEIIIVVGIVVLAVVAILASLQSNIPSPVPVDVGQSQQSVQNSLSTMYASSADDIIRIMESHGGYLSLEVLENSPYTLVEGPTFLGNGVPYWTRGGADTSPDPDDVESWLEKGLEIRISEGMDDIAFDKEVVLDKESLNVDATIHKNKIDFSVTLPTTVDGYQIAQPYRFSTPTNFGRLLDFAGDFAAEQSANRFIEYHSLASLYFSPLAMDGEPEIPTNGWLLDCGKVIFRSPNELAESMEDIIGYSLTATLWWQPRPVTTTGVMVFAVEDVNGNVYDDIEVDLQFPDDFSFQFSSPVVIINSNLDYELFGPFTVPNCMSVYTQKYNLEIPVVTSVKDELTGNRFSFASLACIDDTGTDAMVPGDCGISAVTSCDDLDCNANIHVTDSLGAPLEGVTATFGGCMAGVTGSDGTIDAPIKCGSADLTLFHSQEYDFLNMETDSSALENAEFTLPRKSNITINFYQASEDASCAITPADTEYVSVILKSTTGSMDYGFANIDSNYTSSCNITSSGQGCIADLEDHLVTSMQTSNIPSGAYMADIFITNPGIVGSNPDISIPILMFNDIYIFIPAEESVTLDVYLPDSEYPLGYATRCLDGGPGSEAPLMECTPEIYQLDCNPPYGTPPDTCLSLQGYDQRLAWTAEHFYDGPYEYNFKSHLSGNVNCVNNGLRVDKMLEVEP